MKIKSVVANNHKHEFQVRTFSTKRPTLTFPYCKIDEDVRPAPQNPVVEVGPDPELGNEGFTWTLESGDEGTLHIDALLEENLDPEYMAELALYAITDEAIKAVDESGLSKAQIAKKLGTSAAQLHRLLDPAHKQKSIGQMLALLHILGRKVTVEPISNAG